MAPDASDALAVRQKVQQFLTAARIGNLDLLKKIAAQLDEGKGMAKTVEDVMDANKRGALHFAAGEGKTEVCKYLIEELGLDVDTKDEEGETPLLHATRQGHTNTAKYLLEQGANPSTPSDSGATALHHSAATGNIELLSHVLSKGADVNSKSDVGTPLIWAAGHGQADAVKSLLEHGANPNVQTEDDATPLLSAVAAGSLTCTELLIQAGADVNIIAGDATPVHVAADFGSVDILNALLKAGANANITADGVTPLYVAASNGNTEILNALLNTGADPNVIDKMGQKPIQLAASGGNDMAVEILFPLTSKVETIPDWGVDGIIKYMQSEVNKEKGNSLRRDENIQENAEIKNIPEVSPEAKRRAAEAKTRGDDAFKRKEFEMALHAYTQAIDIDPTDATLFSNRSLCWIRVGQAVQALADSKTCRELRPDWPKACYREGAALRLLQRFDEAANAFYEGVKLDPENKELVSAFREVVEAGKKFHGTDLQKW